MKAFVRCFALCALALPLFAQLPVLVPAKPRVRLTTNYGVMVLELEPSAAPRTVENFLMYVKKGHYAGTIFHPDYPVRIKSAEVLDAK